MAFHIDDLYNLEGFCEEYEKILGRYLFTFIIIYFIHYYFTKRNELPKLFNENDSKDIILKCKELFDKIFAIINEKSNNNNFNEDYQHFDRFALF
jgi:hypothetical protein